MVIELLVWLLICCVLIELLCGYWTNKKENWLTKIWTMTYAIPEVKSEKNVNTKVNEPATIIKHYIRCNGKYYKQKLDWVFLSKDIKQIGEWVRIKWVPGFATFKACDWNSFILHNFNSMVYEGKQYVTNKSVKLFVFIDILHLQIQQV